MIWWAVSWHQARQEVDIVLLHPLSSSFDASTSCNFENDSSLWICVKNEVQGRSFLRGYVYWMHTVVVGLIKCSLHWLELHFIQFKCTIGSPSTALNKIRHVFLLYCTPSNTVRMQMYCKMYSKLWCSRTVVLHMWSIRKTVRSQ